MTEETTDYLQGFDAAWTEARSRVFEALGDRDDCTPRFAIQCLLDQFDDFTAKRGCPVSGKPTIAELEAILNDPRPSEVYMLPDGQVRARFTDTETANLREKAAQIAYNACLVPPDDGSPTEAETDTCNTAAARIRDIPLPDEFLRAKTEELALTVTQLDGALHHIGNLRRALQVAVAMLSPHEPGDSRAVSDEFVALAAMSCGIWDARDVAVIDAALSRLSEGEPQ